MLFRHMITAGVVFFALCLGGPMMLASTADARQIQVFEFLSQTVHLSEDELEALKAGEAVSLELPSSPKNELFLFGAIRIDTPLGFYLARHQNPLPFEKGMVQSWGEFHVPPRNEDLKDLTWPAEDLEDLPWCRQGNCKIKLPAGYIERLQSVNGDKSLFAERANALLRRTLIDYLSSYLQHGNTALMEYRDKQQAISLADEFDGILKNSSHLNPYTHDLQIYLKDFPENRPSKTEDRFIWAKVLLGGKAKRPIIFLYHLIMYRLPGGNGTAIAMKQLYASHYYEAALDFTLPVPDPENPSRFYLLQFDRERIDVLREIPGFLSNGLRGETSRLLARRLEEMKKEANGRYWW